jgi:hypothetical protein
MDPNEAGCFAAFLRRGTGARHIVKGTAFFRQLQDSGLFRDSPPGTPWFSRVRNGGDTMRKILSSFVQERTAEGPVSQFIRLIGLSLVDGAGGIATVPIASVQGKFLSGADALGTWLSADATFQTGRGIGSPRAVAVWPPVLLLEVMYCDVGVPLSRLPAELASPVGQYRLRGWTNHIPGAVAHMVTMIVLESGRVVEVDDGECRAPGRRAGWGNSCYYGAAVVAAYELVTKVAAKPRLAFSTPCSACGRYVALPNNSRHFKCQCGRIIRHDEALGWAQLERVAALEVLGEDDVYRVVSEMRRFFGRTEPSSEIIIRGVGDVHDLERVMSDASDSDVEELADPVPSGGHEDEGESWWQSRLPAHLRGVPISQLSAQELFRRYVEPERLRREAM